MKILYTFIIITGCVSFLKAQQQITNVNPFSSNLPIFIINTNGQTIVDEPKILTDLKVIYNGEGVLNNSSETNFHYDGKLGIEYRGNSSQLSPKKSFGIETRDQFGDDINVQLLGMPKEEDWTLLATPGDRSLLRNSFIFSIWNQMGRYSVKSKFVEVILNDSYQGVYLFTEKIKRDKNRVDIKKLEPNDVRAEDITGGYIIKNDWTAGSSNDAYWVSSISNSDVPKTFIVDYPKSSDLTNAQFEYIRDYFLEFENALKGSNFKDPTTGYRKYIHEDTFVDFFLIQEFSKNLDAYLASIFFHKDRGDKLKVGPIWDFDGAMLYGGGPCCQMETTSNWMFKTTPQLSVMDHFWWEKLLEDCHYSTLFRNRFASLRSTVLSDSNITSVIDSLANTLNSYGAAQRNMDKWQYTLYGNAVNNSTEINSLKTWILNRVEWVENNIADIDPYSIEIAGSTHEQVNYGESHILQAQTPCYNNGSYKWNIKTDNSFYEVTSSTFNTQSLVEDAEITLSCVSQEGCVGYNSPTKYISLQNIPCLTVLNTSITVELGSNPVGLFQAEEYINSTNKLNSGTFSNFSAGKAILFTPGFETEQGAVFTTQLKSCSED